MQKRELLKFSFGKRHELRISAKMSFTLKAPNRQFNPLLSVCRPPPPPPPKKKKKKKPQGPSG